MKITNPNGVSVVVSTEREGSQFIADSLGVTEKINFGWYQKTHGGLPAYPTRGRLAGFAFEEE